MGHQVIAPLVQAKTGSGYVHVYEGGFLPDDQDAEQLQQMLAAGLVEEADQPSSDEKPAASRGKKKK